MLLYSWYSWPTVVLCFFGGFIIDRLIGVRMGSIYCCLFLLVGQLLFATGTWYRSIVVMCAGRFLFGIGGETLAVAQNTYSVQWFEGKELNFVFGLQLSMARIGSTVNMNAMLPIYNSIKQHFLTANPLAVALFIAASTCVFSLLCALVLAWLDARKHRLTRDRMVTSSASRDVSDDDQVVKFSDVLNFNLQLWIIFLVCVTYYIGVFVFISMATILFEKKFNFTPTQATAVNSIVYLLSAPLSPLLGLLVDYMGRHVMLVIAATSLGLFAHILLAFTHLNPWAAMTILGCSYSLVACALWPMVSYLVPKHQLCTAYGLMQSIQNLGMALMSIFSGMIIDKYGLYVLQITFVQFLAVSVLLSIILAFVDARRGSNLNISAKMRNAMSATLSPETNNYEKI